MLQLKAEVEFRLFNVFFSGKENGIRDFDKKKRAGCRKIDETLMDMKRAVIPRLHDTGMNFRAEMKISLRYKNRSGLAPA